MEKYLNVNTLAIAYLALFVFSTVLLVLFLFLRFKTKKLLKGASGNSLEDVLNKHENTIYKNSQELEKITKDIKIINEKNLVNFQKFAIKRFNPFKDIGGDQSFVLVMLDGKNNGFVISSLYREDGARVYAKPIIDGKSTYNLAVDEKEMLGKALNKA